MNYLALTTVAIAITACSHSPANSTEASTDSVNTQAPDTSRTIIPDSVRKNTVQLDTSWSQAVQTMSDEKAGPQDPETQSKIVKAGTINAANQKGQQGPVSPIRVNPFRPQELMDGLKKAQAGDLAGAIVDFTAAIKKNPRNYNAYFYRSKARIESGNPTGAMEDINNAIANKGDEALYYYYRGKMLSDIGQSGKALMDFDKAVKIRKNFPDAWNFMGVEKAKQGFHKEAILDYDSAIIYNPDYALFVYNKGTSLAALGDFEAAVDCFTKAIGLSPKDVMSYMNRGNCYVQLKSYTQAMSDFDKAIELDPKNSDAYYNRGAVHYFIGDQKMCPDWRKAASMGNRSAKAMLDKYCK
ncbi:MAG: tetratricopeptide repeat protein [Bacteroidales bacterium]|nr:tetratricopeptide repeat protein [Bacteroidales bacterium]